MPRKPVQTARPTSARVVVETYGDPDDHLRMSTLIADAIAKGSGSPRMRGIARRLVDTTHARGWHDRRSDFAELAEGLDGKDVTIVVRDPDGFAEAVGGNRSDDWDDARLRRDRADFFGLLQGASNRGGLLVDRTAPNPRMSDALESAPAHADTQDPWAGVVAPDARQALRWLLTTGRIQEASVDDLLHDEAGLDVDRHLVRLAYDHLPPSARDASHRVAILRGPQPLNGTIGPFPTRGKQGLTAPKADLQQLRECGFLLAVPEAPGAVRMPRLVREVVSRRAEALDPDRVEQEQRWAAHHTDERATASSIERHHHAVRGLDQELAIATAVFYVTDLRELASGLSAKERWSDAAATYRAILARDDRDAYAWAYLGYNLAREDAAAHRRDILHAYERAHELDETNPLFHGRLLGFRGGLGMEIDDEVRRGIQQYLWRGLDRFAYEVLTGLRRAKRSKQARVLYAAYPMLHKYPEVARVLAD